MRDEISVPVEIQEVTTRRVQSSLSLHSLVGYACRGLLSKYGINSESAFVEGGKIMDEEEHHTSHSYFVKVVLVEKPTEDQLEVMKVVEKFRQLSRKSVG